METAAATTAPEQAEDEWATRGLRPTLVRGSLRDVEDLESGLTWERFLYWHVQDYDGRCLVRKSSPLAASTRALFNCAIELRDRLAARGLTLREDSALCSDFIALGVGSVPRIVTVAVTSAFQQRLPLVLVPPPRPKSSSGPNNYL
ncbi:hypothetical protein FOA52_005572 [Chlamydomonas sp. UWO 241]|nr:hypothetical protein FOA52_005572 [Chlamydomonas sp. UWO 241]